MKRMREPELGFAALIVFVGGMVVAPLGHLIGHRDDHRHGPSGVIEPIDDETCLAEPEHVEPSRARRAFTHAWEREREAREAREHAAAHARCELAAADRAARTSVGRGALEPTDAQPDPQPVPPRKPSDHGTGALHFGVSLLATVDIVFVALDRIVIAAPLAPCTPQLRVARRHHTPGSARAPPARA